MPTLPATILHIQENPADVALLNAAFDQLAFPTTIIHLADFDVAVAHLRELDVVRDQNLPDLIICDQRLPKGEGAALLELIVESDHLRHVPTFLYTTPPDTPLLHSHLYSDRILEKPSTFDGYIMDAVRFRRAIIARRGKPGQRST